MMIIGEILLKVNVFNYRFNRKYVSRNYWACMGGYFLNGVKEICVNLGNRMHLAQNRNFWKTIVNETLNIRVPKPLELTTSI